MLRTLALSLLLFIPPLAASAADDFEVTTVSLPEWKAVFGRIEARDRIPARSRLGGTLVAVTVSEGATVAQGQQIATIVDEKLDLQLGAVDATLASLQSQLENAEAELKRGESLLERGVTTAQQLDALRTRVDVIKGQIGSAEAERSVLKQREAEGAVLAPIAGTVLDVPVTEGSVVLGGEVIASIGGGGFFLRLAIPERHAGFLEQGAEIRIVSNGDEHVGTLAKVYPLIENGRVIADIDLEGITTDFVDARVLVRVPIGTTQAIVVPRSHVVSRMGLDFVAVAGTGDGAVMRTVVLGRGHEIDGQQMIEVLSGLRAGETLVVPHE